MHNNYNTEESGAAHLTTGLEIALDFESKTATSTRRMWNPQSPVFVVSQGSYQPLANDHVLLGHGAMPVIEEYDQNGALVMGARFGYDRTMQSYRAYRKTWVGTPRTKPSVKACREMDGGSITLYVSWNGATDIQSWEVLSASKKGKFEVIQTVPRNGFETKISVNSRSNSVAVKAVGGPNGGVVSEVVNVGKCE